MKWFALPIRVISNPTISKKESHHRSLRQRMADVTFIFPAVLIFSAVVMYPIISSLISGFTDWNGVSQTAHFIGFHNFIAVFADINVQTAFTNTLIFTLCAAVLQNGIALGLALALDHVTSWLKGVGATFRILFLIPMLLSPLAIGYLGQYIFSPTFGLLDNALTVVHLTSLTRDWLGDPHSALGSVIATNLWQYVGYNMIIFLAGLQTVPRDLYESAGLDGANSFQQFWYVTWPMIAQATTISLILTLIGGFKVFDLIFAMTNGGPGYATESVVMRFYREGFQFNHFGYAAAISILLCLFIFVLSLLVLSLLRRREIEL